MDFQLHFGKVTESQGKPFKIIDISGDYSPEMKEPVFLNFNELKFKIPEGQRSFRRYLRTKKVAKISLKEESGTKRKGTLLQEFLECSSIHGLNHLAKKNRHWSEYFLWIVVLAAAVTGTAFLGHQAWRRYHYFPTVISIEKDYKNWNTTFVMATVCPKDRVNDTKLVELAKRYRVHNVRNFVHFFKLLAGSSYEGFGSLPNYEEVKPTEYLQILAEAKFNFTYELSNSQGINQDLLLLVTENGLCYSFNTEIGVYFSVENFNARLPVRRRNELIRGSPLDGELFAQIMKMNSGYNVSLNGPYDLPDMGVRHLPMEMWSYLLLDITALSIISSNSIRALSPMQRQCRFFDESNLEISDIYSYNLCRMQCRADLAFKLCGCIPYFYRSKQKPYCGASGMKCLGKQGRSLSELRDASTKEKFKCGCLPLCNDVHYVIEYETHLQWKRATNLKFRMAQYPRTRLRREIIFGFADLVVSIGGTAGLLLGCSLLSFIEIVYFFALNTCIFLKKYVAACKNVTHRAIINPRNKKQNEKKQSTLSDANPAFWGRNIYF